MEEAHVDSLAQIIWNYHLMNQLPEPSDCILVSCSNDIRVANRGAELLLKGLAPVILFSGGHGAGTKDWDKPEADTFAEIAISLGVSRDQILIENRSTNTEENIKFSRKLLSEKNIVVNKVQIIQKPYMERRVYATFKKVWPEIDITVTSPQIPYLNYPNDILSREEIINTIVGYTQRIKVYSEKGFQIHQDIPNAVWEAYEELISLGYNKMLIKK